MLLGIIIFEIVAVLLFALAGLFISGKGGALLAGWNTMSQTERSKYLVERGITEKELLKSTGFAKSVGLSKGAQMNKQPEITAATKKTFVDAFCSLYACYPIEKITVQEIVRKANYNRSTFYQYFKDAYDLLEFLEDEIIGSIKKKVDANLDRIDFADSFIQSFGGLPEETQHYAAVLLANPQSTNFAQRAKAAMMPIILRHFDISESDEKAAYVFEFYLAGVISIASRWLREGRRVPPGEIGRLIHILLTEGALSALNRGVPK
jgi:AcrR family transcriptional regulator